MAYGVQARPGGGANPKGIPANSILVFDVQVVNTKHPAPPAIAPVLPRKDSVIVIKPEVQKKDSVLVPAPPPAEKKNK